jgi:hypothetical protein
MKIITNVSIRSLFAGAILATGLLLTGCVPTAARPTLDEVRLGEAGGEVAVNAGLQPGEIRAEIAEIDRSRRNVHVIAEDNRRHALPYDIDHTRVLYHGREYAVDNLEAGDRIAYRSLPRDMNYVETIRVLEPVQARTAPASARSISSRPSHDVVEGTVENVDHGLGVFEIRPRTGRAVTVSVPYNATTTDVDSFRGLRRGDYVRVEGEFVNPESLQLLSFLSPRDR